MNLGMADRGLGVLWWRLFYAEGIERLKLVKVMEEI